MTRYIALLRAVNVGGTGTLKMSDLKAICVDAGFDDVETYIASGNVVFESRSSAAKVKSELERRLKAHAGKPIKVLVRSASEAAAILKANPFPDAEAKHTYAVFLDEPPARDALAHVTGRKDEQVLVGKKEFYVLYRSGMGRSKLKIPAAKDGTARNMNTVAKLVEMASAPGKRS
jgi:uncharacterized protein (DUF1697 family)